MGIRKGLVEEVKSFDLLFQDSPDIAFLKKKLKVEGDFPMSKKSAMKDPRTNKRPLQALTRKQQVAALRTLKAQEVADNVAGSIRDAVKQEVELQLGSIKDVMMELIDSVSKLEKEVYMDEGDSSDRQEGEEALEDALDPEVVQESGIERPDDFSIDNAYKPASG